MFTKLFVLGAALIIAVPAFAASSGGGASGSANSSAAVGHGGGSGGGSGTAGGGSGAGAHGGGLGAHSAAISTHLGGAGHTLHAATAHAVTGRATQSQRVAMVNGKSKNPSHDDGRSRHIFLHRTANYSPLDWSICMSRLPAADGRWSDCDRPAKSSSGPHT
jgi:hypothetical protein